MRWVTSTPPHPLCPYDSPGSETGCISAKQRERERTKSAVRKREKPYKDNHPQCTLPGSNSNPSAFGSHVQHESSALDHAATGLTYGTGPPREKRPPATRRVCPALRSHRMTWALNYYPSPQTAPPPHLFLIYVRQTFIFLRASRLKGISQSRTKNVVLQQVNTRSHIPPCKCTLICVEGEWKTFLEKTLSTPDQDSNLDLPGIGSLAYYRSYAFDHVGTEEVRMQQPPPPTQKCYSKGHQFGVHDLSNRANTPPPPLSHPLIVSTERSPDPKHYIIHLPFHRLRTKVKGRSGVMRNGESRARVLTHSLVPILKGRGEEERGREFLRL
uniref:(California timema) hypothetical protein n=1 Tax=Timema californicum TaxID=61474 RepID=A0A7R9IUU1_TIMCA|nr:unnamed protein product [Timema californicum]